MIADDTIAEIRERTDIAALIGEFVSLKRAGTNYKGVCPFHQEKTPSFNVNPGRQIFHCFGCGVGGDAFKFLMQFEGRTFVEAARELARRAGVLLPELKSTQARTESDRREKHRERLLAVTAAAAEFYVRALATHPAANAARGYLAARGISDGVREKFQLGFAPPAWDELASHLGKKSYSPAEAEEVGLIIARPNSGGHYDRFRNRLMCPVFSQTGRIIAFSGRILPGETDPEKAQAKYINSPESAIFRKGEVLFGLHASRVAIRRLGFAILVEGNFDLLQMHEHQIDDVVAPMGTAFTIEQAQVLRRYAPKVVLLFDGDEAGRKAARASFAVTAAAGLRAEVAMLPAGQDPDSYLRDKGADALRALCSNGKGIVEHLIDEAAAMGGRSVQDRAASIRQIGETLRLVQDPLERDMYVGRIAQAFEIDAAMVLKHLRPAAPDKGDRGGHATAASVQPADLPSIAELAIFGAVLDHPDLGVRLSSASADLTSAALREAVAAIGALGEAGRPFDAMTVLDAISDPALRAWAEARLVEPALSVEQADLTVRSNIERLRRAKTRRQAEDFTRRIAEAQARGDEAAVDELIREKNRLRDELRN